MDQSQSSCCRDIILILDLSYILYRAKIFLSFQTLSEQLYQVKNINGNLYLPNIQKTS